MELAADIVQDISKFFKIMELESAVNFPQEMEAFEEVLKRVAEYNALRVRMSADMADDSQRVKVYFSLSLCLSSPSLSLLSPLGSDCSCRRFSSDD
jgi:hypothetical protein